MPTDHFLRLTVFRITVFCFSATAIFSQTVADLLGLPDTKAFCTNRTSDDCLQIATFNIEWFPLGRPENRKDIDHALKVAERQKTVADFILQQDWEIIAVQEVQGGGTFRRFVKNYLGESYRSISTISGRQQRIAIVWKHDLLQLISSKELFSDKKNAPYYDRTNRRPLQANFLHKKSGRQFSVIAVHFKSNGQDTSCEKRRTQVNDLSRYVQTVDLPWLLLGDFNDVIAGNGICSRIDTMTAFEQLPQAGFLTSEENIHPPGTATYFLKPYRSVIDHILISDQLLPDLFPAQSRRAFVLEHNDRKISDHNPVEIWLHFR